MNQSVPPPKTNNELAEDRTELAEDRTELAKYRSRAAADRTLMAWIRTSLSLISFGFGLPTIIKALEKTYMSQEIKAVSFSVVIGLSFIGVGMFALALALREHRQILKLIKSDRYIYEYSKTTEIVALILIGIGVISFCGVIINLRIISN